ncbi:DUF3817 domain-containing protein [Aestuariivivens sediminis]|uniref:DUF3817 domain-containing protein n=1 Tax=Aestuariivivens sediminis TaxID=2913557 RepID=UPI001F59FE4F|nr:DUF3817 domain-containing protein [Aestuariivivens sediminis]
MSYIRIFRVVAFLEGLSYVLLLFVATPIKYTLDDPQYVKLLGMPHGLLFIAYFALSIILKPTLKWTNRQFNHVLLASVIPFGTFYIDKKFLSLKHE